MIKLTLTRGYLYKYSGIEPETKENVRYAHGDLPARYPVPAIAIGVCIASNYVLLYEKYHQYNGREWYSTYLY